MECTELLLWSFGAFWDLQIQVWIWMWVIEENENTHCEQENVSLIEAILDLPIESNLTKIE